MTTANDTTNPAPAAAPDGLKTCLDTATATATALLGDNNSCADATVKLTTSVQKGGKLQTATYEASVGLAKYVSDAIDHPAPAPAPAPTGN